MMEFLHAHHTGEDEGLWPLVRQQRAYRSPRREQQAAEPRSMVASAAARLFGERG